MHSARVACCERDNKRERAAVAWRAEACDRGVARGLLSVLVNNEGAVPWGGGVALCVWSGRKGPSA